MENLGEWDVSIQGHHLKAVWDEGGGGGGGGGEEDGWVKLYMLYTSTMCGTYVARQQMYA